MHLLVRTSTGGFAQVEHGDIVPDLVDNSGGTADGTVQAVAGTGADATINNNFADLVAKVNAILAELRQFGIVGA